MVTPKCIVIDFETHPIYDRPRYPPVPVGFSLKEPGGKTQYLAWGHPIGNNTTLPNAKRVLKKAWASGLPLLFHNDKFDVDVAETHMGCPRIPALRMHDTMFLLFLDDPHQMSLALKPSAERILNMKPKEKDAVMLWLVQHQDELRSDGLLPAEEPKLTVFNAGKWICLAPGQLVGVYADGDVIRTERIFRKLYPSIVARGMLPAYEREQKLMPILLDNEREGMRTNLRALQRDVKVYDVAMMTADNYLRKTLKTPNLNVDSDAELAKALDECGIITEWTLTKTGKKSTSKKNMKLEHFGNKNVAQVLGYRNRLATCLGTFMKPWLYTAQQTGGIIHTQWNQTKQSRDKGGNIGTRSGRLSSSPNFQNIPKDFTDKGDGYVHPKILRLPELPLMRRYILADSTDHWFIRRDFNQQELRLLAHFEDDKLLQAYLENPEMDVHGFVQHAISELLGIDLPRTPVKTLNFGLIYGQGVPSMAEKLNREVREIKTLRDAQMKALPGLKALSDNLKNMGHSGVPLHTWGGREYYCEEPRFVEKRGRVVSFEYKMLNYLIQPSAADVTKETIIRYHEHPKRVGRMIVNVHDEINPSAPKKALREEALLLRDVMLSIETDVPMLSDAEYGPNWHDMKDLKEPKYNLSKWGI